MQVEQKPFDHHGAQQLNSQLHQSSYPENVRLIVAGESSNNHVLNWVSWDGKLLLLMSICSCCK